MYVYRRRCSPCWTACWTWTFHPGSAPCATKYWRRTREVIRPTTPSSAHIPLLVSTSSLKLETRLAFVFAVCQIARENGWKIVFLHPLLYPFAENANERLQHNLGRKMSVTRSSWRCPDHPPQRLVERQKGRFLFVSFTFLLPQILVLPCRPWCIMTWCDCSSTGSGRSTQSADSSECSASQNLRTRKVMCFLLLTPYCSCRLFFPVADSTQHFTC